MIDTSSRESTAPAENFLPGPILLLGAPGVGKGTQSQLLMAEYGIPQISTGDLFRENIRLETPLGLETKQVLARGELVSDSLVNKMVADRLSRPDTESGYILDGFPRTLPQAVWLDTYLGTRPRSLPVIAILIEVNYDKLVERITGRFTCPACGTIYNSFTRPPEASGICDLDGTTLQQRSDDRFEVFVERLNTFQEATAPVIEHYRNQQRFCVVDGDQPVDAVSQMIRAMLNANRTRTVSQ